MFFFRFGNSHCSMQTESHRDEEHGNERHTHLRCSFPLCETVCHHLVREVERSAHAFIFGLLYGLELIKLTEALLFSRRPFCLYSRYKSRYVQRGVDGFVAAFTTCQSGSKWALFLSGCKAMIISIFFVLFTFPPKTVYSVAEVGIWLNDEAEHTLKLAMKFYCTIL